MKSAISKFGHECRLKFRCRKLLLFLRLKKRILREDPTLNVISILRDGIDLNTFIWDIISPWMHSWQKICYIFKNLFKLHACTMDKIVFILKSVIKINILCMNNFDMRLLELLDNTLYYICNFRFVLYVFWC